MEVAEPKTFTDQYNRQVCYTCTKICLTEQQAVDKAYRYSNGKGRMSSVYGSAPMSAYICKEGFWHIGHRGNRK